MLSRITTLLLFLIAVSCATIREDDKGTLADEIEYSIQNEMLNVWYPAVIDSTHGGYLSTFTYDFKSTGSQDKMIVTQARHVWTSSKAFMAYPEKTYYKDCAVHGFKFLRDVMWDKQYGGFHTLVDRQGNIKSSVNEQKTAYGNAFGIYALSAYYMATKDTAALSLVKKAFTWLEQHSHDSELLGYFQHMQRDGTPIKRDNSVPSTSDLGYKDQNSSIHLLEAFTELYQVWPNELVLTRLKEMLTLIRDTITTDKGYLVLFLQPDWTPVSFRDSSEDVILSHRQLDHVSFGHDVETAYLMLEASHIAGIKNDTKTSEVAKRMVDHSLKYGWDNDVGGFYDEGYYFKNEPSLRIIKDTKNWWAQAEGLNTLLMMAELYPNDEQQYMEKFKKLWAYTKQYLIDHEHGEWYQGGLDKEPEQRTGLKAHIWKASYHQYRSLSNCLVRLKSNSFIDKH